MRIQTAMRWAEGSASSSAERKEDGRAKGAGGGSGWPQLLLACAFPSCIRWNRVQLCSAYRAAGLKATGLCRAFINSLFPYIAKC